MGLRGKTFLIAGIIEIGSLLFIGWSPRFLYGLALGCVVAIGNYSLLTVGAKLSLHLKSGVVVNILSYIVRMCIYAATFLISYRLGTESGIATIFGFMTLKIALYHEHGIKPGFRNKKEE